jgi:hypothetical protein
MKKRIWLSALALVATSGIGASEFRAPLTAQHGPLCYDIETKSDKWTFHYWSTSYQRSAHKSFMKHSFKTKELPSVIFGKETFTLSESFQDASIRNYYTTQRNPLLGITKFKPRASYTERGVVLGGQFEYPIYKEQGRLGLRAHIPFRKVRVERDDEGEARLSGENESVVRNDVAIISNLAKNTSISLGGVNKYKLKLVDQMIYLEPGGKVVSAFRANAANTASGIYGTQYVKNKNANDHMSNAYGQQVPFTLIKSKKNPYGQKIGAVYWTNGAFAADATQETQIRLNGGDNSLKALPTSAAEMKEGEIYAFAQDSNYTNFSKSPGFEDVWLVQVFGTFTRKPTSTSQGVTAFVETELGQNHLPVEQWLKRYGDFEITTMQRMGIGDFATQLFYEHTLNKEWRFEGFLGMVMPTGGTSKYAHNPYFNMGLGNGNHVELNLGANAGWETPLDVLSMKAEAMFALVLKATEKRAATFKGATIKNIGPALDANVNWQYFKMGVDSTWHHPKRDTMCGTLGYELYYKLEDNIKFKESKTDQHWLGEAWSDANDKNVTLGGAAGTKYAPHFMEIDNNLAKKDTDRIAHRVKAEFSWRAREFMDLYCGGAFTFAGMFIPRVTDMFGGMKVLF